MYNSDFEKEVQQKLEELRLSPSDTMWERIENELPKKRRRYFLWLLLPFAGLLIWLTVQYFSLQNKASTAKAVVQQPKAAQPAESAQRAAMPSAGQHHPEQTEGAPNESKPQQQTQTLPDVSQTTRKQVLPDTAAAAQKHQPQDRASALLPTLSYRGSTVTANANVQQSTRRTSKRAGKISMKIQSGTDAETAAEAEDWILAAPGRYVAAIIPAERADFKEVLLQQQLPIPNNYGLKIHRLKAMTESHWIVL